MSLPPELTKQSSYWFGPGSSKTIAREQRPVDPIPPASLLTFTLEERSIRAKIRRNLRRACTELKYAHMFCESCNSMHFLKHLGSIPATACYYDPFELEKEREALKKNGWRHLTLGPRGPGWYALKKGVKRCPNGHLLLSDNILDQRDFQLQSDIKLKNVLVAKHTQKACSGYEKNRLYKAEVVLHYKGCKTYRVKWKSDLFYQKKTRHIRTKHYAAKYIQPDLGNLEFFDRMNALYYHKIYQRGVDFKLMQKLCEHVQSFSAQPVTIHDAVFANNLPLLQYFVQVRGVSPNYINKTPLTRLRSQSPLYCAAYIGNISQVEYLLQMGGTDRNGSVYRIATQQVRTLLRKGYHMRGNGHMYGDLFHNALARKKRAIDYGFLKEAMVCKGVPLHFLPDYKKTRSFIFNLAHFKTGLITLLRHPAPLHRLWWVILSFMHSNWFIVQGCNGYLSEFENDPWIPQ